MDQKSHALKVSILGVSCLKSKTTNKSDIHPVVLLPQKLYPGCAII